MLDLFSEGYVICSGRRQRLQQMEWTESDPEMDVPLTEAKDIEHDEEQGFGASLNSQKPQESNVSLLLTYGETPSFAKPSIQKVDSVSSGEQTDLSLRSAAASSLTRKGFTSLRDMSGGRDIVSSPNRRASNPLGGSFPLKRSGRARSLLSEPTAMPQTLGITVAGDATSLSGSYKFDSMRGGSAVWSNGISSIRRKGDNWEIREGYGEASTRIVSLDPADGRWPNEMTRWSDSHGFPAEVKIQAKDLQTPSTSPLKSRRSFNTTPGSSAGGDQYSFLIY